ncbi:MAG: hypothetical protein ABI851_00655 [Saprospiraceae bacterium]
MKTIFTLITLLLINFANNAQNIVIHKDLAPGIDHGIYYYGFEYAQTDKFMYFQGRPNFTTGLYRTNGNLGHVESLPFNDTIFNIKLITASGTKIYFTGIGDHKSLYCYDELSGSIQNLLSTKGGDDYKIVSMSGNAALLIRSNTFMISRPNEIWYTDGSVSNTKKIYESDQFPSILQYSKFGESLIISDNSTNITQAEAIISDGTIIGTMTVKDAIKSRLNLENVDDAIGLGNKMFIFGKKLENGSTKYTNYILSISAIKDLGYLGNFKNVFATGKYYVLHVGTELYSYDTIKDKSLLITDIAGTQYLKSFKDNLFFTLNGSTKKELWQTDGSLAGTLQVSDDIGKTFLNVFNIGNFGNKIHYLRSLTEVELWEYDMLSKQNRKLTNLFTSSPIIYEPSLIYFKNKLFFAKETKETGSELWVYSDLNSSTFNQQRDNIQFAQYNSVYNELVLLENLDNQKINIELININGAILKQWINYQGKKLSLENYLPSEGVFLIKINSKDKYQLLKIVKN